KWTHSTVGLGNVVTTNQTSSVTLALESLDEVSDVVDQILAVLLGGKAIDAVSSVFADVPPAFQQEVFFTDETVEVEEPIVLSLFGLVGYCQQRGLHCLLRLFLAGQCFLCRLAYFCQPLPPAGPMPACERLSRSQSTMS